MGTTRPRKRMTCTCSPRSLGVSLTRRSVEAVVSSIGLLYQRDAVRFENVTDVAKSLGWDEITGQTLAEYFGARNVNPRWTLEFVDAMTRVNYAQVSTWETVDKGYSSDDRAPERRRHSWHRRHSLARDDRRSRSQGRQLPDIREVHGAEQRNRAPQHHCASRF